MGPGSVVELRALDVVKAPGKPPATWAGFFDTAHARQMAGHAVELSKIAKGVYWTLNPLMPDLLARRYNKVDWAGRDLLANDSHAVRRRWLLVDADPVRIAGVSATDEEKRHAHDKALEVREWLASLGWPGPVFSDSGNGYHLLYRVDLPPDDGGLVERALWALAHRFDDERVKVDRKVFNPSRICKLPGTWARKGSSTPERPHRTARIIDVAGEPLGRGSVVPPDLPAVPRDLLLQLAAAAPAEAAVARPAVPGPGGARGATSRLMVDRWLDDRGVPYRVKAGAGGGTVYVIPCPFDPAHGEDANVTQFAGGATSASCFHNGCAGRHWAEFKAQIGGPEAHHYDPPLEKRKGRKGARGKDADANGPAAPRGARPGQLPEADDDPHRLARLYLGECRATKRGLLWHREEWFRWRRGAYRQVPEKEVRAGLVEAIKREFDDLARIAAATRTAAEKDEGEKFVMPVTGRLAADVMQALASLAMVPGDVEPPAWLFAFDGPDPAGLVVCRNGLLCLDDWAAGRDCLAPPTPHLFALSALPFDFDPAPPPASEWLKFLGQLWPDGPQSVELLQEWFGYCLTPDTSQQKILMLVGPQRSGKGTILRVLTELVGKANVCNPTIGSLGTPFGLEQLLRKTLAIFTDARLSGRHDDGAVVEHLLSISGEDSRTVQRKFREAVTGRLPVRLIVATNEVPRLAEASGALAGRLLLLQTERSFAGSEDRHLTRRLLGELPGILLWSMEGWRRLRDRGHFVQPDAAEALMQEVQDLTSPVNAFVRECCLVGPTNTVLRLELYLRYCEWCQSHGEKPATSNVFGRDLRAVMQRLGQRLEGAEVTMFVGDKRRKMRQYVGVTLRPDGQEEDAPAQAAQAAQAFPIPPRDVREEEGGQERGEECSGYDSEMPAPPAPPAPGRVGIGAIPDFSHLRTPGGREGGEP